MLLELHQQQSSASKIAEYKKEEMKNILKPFEKYKNDKKNISDTTEESRNISYTLSVFEQICLTIPTTDETKKIIDDFLTKNSTQPDDVIKSLIQTVGELRLFIIDHQDGIETVQDFWYFIYRRPLGLWYENDYLLSTCPRKQFTKEEAAIVKEIYTICYKDSGKKTKDYVKDLYKKLIKMMDLKDVQYLNSDKKFLEDLFYGFIIIGSCGIGVMIFALYLYTLEQQNAEYNN